MARNISVVLPHYQKQAALMVSISEWAQQLKEGDELIIVDDHSPDAVPEYKEPWFKLIRPTKHEPHIYRLNTLRNHGIQHAENDAVAIVDPDCKPNENFVQNAKRLFDPAVLFAGMIQYLNKKGGLLKDDPRTGNGKSRWCDRSNRSCGMVWGGCMYFSKSRAGLVGLFDTEFDGHWGAEEHAFGSACRNSGMRLRYETGLTVYHQWHQKVKYGDPQRNIKLFREKIALHRHSLNLFTKYKPAVAVLYITTMRPYFIEQALRAIFRNRIPIKLELVNNGDQSKEQKNTLAWWSDRWTVDYQDYKEPELISKIRTETLKKYREKGYKYLLLQDDDITMKPGALTKLVRAAEAHPEYHAIAGYIYEWPGHTRSLGGIIKNSIHYDYPIIPGVNEVEYLSSGFTLIRLNKIVPYSKDWEMGWADWDWAHEIRNKGLRLAICGDAGAYHRYILTPRGPQHRRDSDKYRFMRHNEDRHRRMADRFEKKWGYRPKAPLKWPGPIIPKTS